MESTTTRLIPVKHEINQEIPPPVTSEKKWKSHKIIGLTCGALALAGTVAGGLFIGIPYWIAIAAVVTAVVIGLGISKLATAQAKEIPPKVEIMAPKSELQKVEETEIKPEKREFRIKTDKIKSWALEHKGIIATAIGLCAIASASIKGYQAYVERQVKLAVEAAALEAANEDTMVVGCFATLLGVAATGAVIHQVVKFVKNENET